MKANDLNKILAAQCMKTCEHLLPGGRPSHGNWVVGGTNNDEGKSLHIQLEGSKAGVWIDFATGEKGDLIGLWQAVRNMSLKDSCIEAAEFLGLPPDEEDMPATSKSWLALQREMGTGTEDDIATLRALRRLPVADGLRLAIESDTLFFGPVFDKAANQPGATHHCWIITDNARLGAQARRMDGLPFADGQKSKTIHGTTGRWPVGIEAAGTLDLALVEGGPDFLAAYTAVSMLGLQNQIQPVAMLGSSQSIHPRALPKFSNKTAWLFPHNDENNAGLLGAIRWEAQLKRVNTTIIPFDFRPYPGVKDLNDFVAALMPQEAPEGFDLDESGIATMELE